MDRSQLEDLYKVLPGITSVSIYARYDGGEYDAAKPYAVGAAEQRPIGSQDERLFENVSGDVERCLWHLWVSSITAPWIPSFSPLDVKVARHWLIKESGGREWVVVSTNLEMSRTRWRCPSIEYLGDPIIQAGC